MQISRVHLAFIRILKSRIMLTTALQFPSEEDDLSQLAFFRFYRHYYSATLELRQGFPASDFS
jgi:hypothetical protein